MVFHSVTEAGTTLITGVEMLMTLPSTVVVWGADPKVCVLKSVHVLGAAANAASARAFGIGAMVVYVETGDMVVTYVVCLISFPF